MAEPELTAWATLRGVPVLPGPLTGITGGSIILTELGQFNKSTITATAEDANVILAMQEYTLLELVQSGVGTIAYGYVMNPRQQITEQDEHSVTFELEPLTVECTWELMHRGWIAQNYLSIIASRIGSFVPPQDGHPGWQGNWTDGSATDIIATVTINNSTVLAAWLDVAKQFSQYARVGVDANGAPTRILEMGQFGLPPTMWLTSANGGDAEVMGSNGLIRLVATVDREPNDVSNLINVCVPFGGGSGDAIVTLERLWRTINDPTYVNYGRWGSEEQSIANTGKARVIGDSLTNTPVAVHSTASSTGTVVASVNVQQIVPVIDYNVLGVDGTSLWAVINAGTIYGFVPVSTIESSVFPEYDPKYPISDPRNPPNGVAPVWWSTLKGATAPTPLAKGNYVTWGPYQVTGVVQLYEYTVTGVRVDSQPVLNQGAIGTRYPCLDGHWDYMVYDYDSYLGSTANPPYGHKMGQFVDSGLNYADNTPANQEMTERALYLETVANFKRFAHPHHTFSCTTPGVGRPTRAGDLISVDYQRVSVNGSGAVVEMNVTENLKVMSVTRVFSPPGSGSETQPMDTYVLSNLGRFDETDATGAAYTAKSLIALQVNQSTSLSPMTIYAADNVDALHPMTVHVSVPPQIFRWQRCNLRVDFEPFRGANATSTNQSGTNISIQIAGQDLTFGVDPNSIGAPPKHRHQIPLFPGGKTGISPGATTAYLYVENLGSIGWRPFANFLQDAGMHMDTNTEIFEVDTSPTSHPHTARIPAQTVIAPLTPHTHDLIQKVEDGPVSPSCTVDINGNQILSGLTMKSGTQNPDGTFPGSFEIDDVSAVLNSITGDIDLVITSYTAPGNQYGSGRFKVSATWFGEFGGLTSTVKAN